MWFRVQFGKKSCTSEFFKGDENCTSAKAEVNLFQFARENVLLPIKNMHGNIIQKQIDVHFHERKTYEINSLLPPLNDTTIQLKFPTYCGQFYKAALALTLG